MTIRRGLLLLQGWPFQGKGRSFIHRGRVTVRSPRDTEGCGHKKVKHSCPRSTSWSARAGRRKRRTPRSRPWKRTRRSAAFAPVRSEEHTSELQSLMRISYAVFCLKKKKKQEAHIIHPKQIPRKR